MGQAGGDLVLHIEEVGALLVEAATERLHQEYDINKRAKDWMNIYEEVCSLAHA